MIENSKLIIFLILLTITLFPCKLPAKKIIIAHRGASGYIAEHTFAAKAMAFQQGANFLEQDVVLTKDNVPIIMHDIYLDTTTNVADIFPSRKRKDGRYYSIDFTFAEIKQLKFSEPFDPVTKKVVYPNRFPLEYNIFTIHSLEDELKFIKGLNKSTNKNVGIYTEIKSPAFYLSEHKDISKIVINMLKKYGYETKKDNFYLQIFDFNELKRIKNKLKFKGKSILLIGENSWNEAPNNDYTYFQTEAGLKEISKYADGIAPWIPQIIYLKKDNTLCITKLVSFAHKYNLVVHPYTARKDELTQNISYNKLLKILFFEANIDGLFTDFPDLGISFIKKNNLY